MRAAQWRLTAAPARRHPVVAIFSRTIASVSNPSLQAGAGLAAPGLDHCPPPLQPAGGAGLGCAVLLFYMLLMRELLARQSGPWRRPLPRPQGH
jgi:hypothetical protein